MKNLLVEVSPVKPDGSIQTVRMCSIHAAKEGQNLDNKAWMPIIDTYPDMGLRLMENGNLIHAKTEFSDLKFICSPVYANEVWDRWNWYGAEATIWYGEDGADFSAYTQIYSGPVGPISAAAGYATVAPLGAEADLGIPLLNLSYLGTDSEGGPEGTPDFRGGLKPWISGYVRNVDCSPHLIDPIHQIYQVHGYGPIHEISALYEYAAPLEAGEGDVATYAELVALDLEPGQWATCLALGCFRLGGAPSYKLTADIKGARNGASFPDTVKDIAQHLIKRFVPTATFGTWGAWADADWGFYAKDATNVGEVVYQAVNDAGGYLIVDGNRTWHTGDFYAEFDDVEDLPELRDDRTSDPLVEQSSVNQLNSAGPAYHVRIGHTRNFTVMGVNDISPIELDFQEDLDELRTLAEQAKEAAEQASADYFVALARLNDMAGDGELDRAEKKYWVAQYQKLYAEKTTLSQSALLYPVQDQIDDLDEAWDALDLYLDTLDPAWDDPTQTTIIVPADFINAWKAVYLGFVDLRSAIAAAAAPLVNWDNITGPGKPDDNATVGAPPGTNIGDIPVEEFVSQVDTLINEQGDVYSLLLKTTVALDQIGRAFSFENHKALEALDEVFQQDSADKATAITAIGTAFDAGQLAQAAENTVLRTKIGDNESAILTEKNARTTADTAEASARTILASRVTNNEAAIVTEQTTRATADTAQATSISSLGVRMGTAETAITNEQSARATADIAQASDITALKSRMGTAEAAIISEQTTRATADTAMATSITSLGARVGTAESAITTEQTARANGDSANATSITAIGVRMGTAETAILDEKSARISADGANTSAIMGLLTRMGDAESSIVSESSARVLGDSTEAVARQAITSRLNNFNGAASVSIETIQATSASKISGLEAQWVVRINNNGVVTGFGLASGAGGTSEFGVQADRFYFRDSSGYGQAPFKIEGGTTYIKSVVVENLSLGTRVLEDYAASKPAFARLGSDIYCPHGGVETEIMSITISKDVAGSLMNVRANLVFTSSDDIVGDILIRDDSGIVASILMNVRGVDGSYASPFPVDELFSGISTGTRTYKVCFRHTNGRADTVYVKANSIFSVTEEKK